MSPRAISAGYPCNTGESRHLRPRGEVNDGSEAHAHQISGYPVPERERQDQYRVVVEGGRGKYHGKRQQLTRTVDTLREARSLRPESTIQANEGTFIKPRPISR